MSEWYETQDDDIFINLKNKEVNIYVTYNDWGNIYKTIKFEQVAEIYEKIGKAPLPKENFDEFAGGL